MLDQADEKTCKSSCCSTTNTRRRKKRRSPDEDDTNAGGQFRKASTTTNIGNLSEKNSRDDDEKLKPSDFLFFAANSTFHGMSHIFTPGGLTLRKGLWAAAFSCSMFLFLLQAYDRYTYYLSRPHVTKLDEKEVEEMTFPAVTICNMNSFRVKEITTDDYFYVGEHILEIFDSNYNLRSKNLSQNKMWPMIEPKIREILQQRNDFQPRATSFNIFEFYNRTGHELNGIVKQCKYRGDDCTPNWSTVFTRYGKCYTFNGIQDEDKLKKTLKGGIDNGLEILLDTQQDNYMPVWTESDEISVEAGFKVQLHNQSEPPFIHELGFGVSPGFQRLVATQEQRITFLPEPYGDCASGANESTHRPYETYSISACRIICETKVVVDECQCKMVHMPGNAPLCGAERYKKCADKKLDELLQQDEKICVCKTPCDVIRYNLQSSALRLPSTRALSYLAFKYNRSEEYITKNFAKLNIFFEALNYETIDQKKAYEVPGLLGDIGGQMGLFIGASILTVLELFDYFYEVVKNEVHGNKRSKKSKKRKRNEATTSCCTRKVPSPFESNESRNHHVNPPQSTFYDEDCQRRALYESRETDSYQLQGLPQINSRQDDKFDRNGAVLQNDGWKSPPQQERTLRRPVSCNVYPYGIPETPESTMDRSSVAAWTSPRPLSKEFTSRLPTERCIDFSDQHTTFRPLGDHQIANDHTEEYVPMETDIH